jgi:xanthine dehydrogenase YagS FAD-binding subunit
VEQALEGQRLSEEVIASAAEAASEGARPLEHNAYKIDLLQGAIRETLRRFKS